MGRFLIPIVSICPAIKLDYLITNLDAFEDDLKAFDEQGIEVVVVEKEYSRLTSKPPRLCGLFFHAAALFSS